MASRPASRRTGSLLPSFDVKPTTPGKVDTDIVGVFQDKGSKSISPKGRYAPIVEKLRKSESFAGRPGQTQYLRLIGKGADNGLLVGLGQAGDLTEEKLRAAGGSVWSKLVAERSRSAVVHVDSFFASGLKTELTHLRVIRAFAEGLTLAAYQIQKVKTSGKGPASKDEYKAPTRVTFLAKEKGLNLALESELKKIQAIGAAVAVTRDWSNEPSNIGTPEYFAGEARRLASEYGLKCKIIGEAEAKREKMELFIGVGQGSEREGKIVVLEYNPKGAKNARKDTKTLALVGKGVTFDSGGISIKPSMRMEEMKHDMTGAATIMGAILLASAWEVPNRVVAIMAFTENMPDGDAIQPGNILGSRAGKTVEVINTDAEGRLILADVLDYAQDMKPDAIVDVATLTGAVVVALGKYCCGILGNDEALIESVRRAGEQNGERIWQLPLYDEYFDDLKSDYADMRNSANDGSGGTIRGAIFLKQFIRKGTAWAHLDIAATAWGVSHLPYAPKKGASGLYVRTLAQLAADL
ncbi:MAG TPA: leucyl aminopeptidase [Bdellovibrionota bacterium]|nr:leucyl aminopeptidase [Bdellovibrionota bacterium]